MVELDVEVVELDLVGSLTVCARSRPDPIGTNISLRLIASGVVPTRHVVSHVARSPVRAAFAAMQSQVIVIQGVHSDKDDADRGGSSQLFTARATIRSG